MIECPDCRRDVAETARRCPYCAKLLATRECPSCGGRSLVLAASCLGCDAPLSEKEASGLADTTCPECGLALEIRDVGGVRLHECGACSGLFLDRVGVARMVEDPDAETSLSAAAGSSPYRGSSIPTGQTPAVDEARARFYRRCPACGTVMSRVNFARRSAVMLDVCPRHGTWFDREELARVRAFAAQGGLEEARKRERDERLREAEEARRASATEGLLAAEAPSAGARRWTDWGALVDMLLEIIGAKR